jgi:methyl acetate hydrolase
MHDMSQALKSTLDGLLSDVVTSTPGVPGVVAMVTDRERNIYEGAAGKRTLGEAAEMTTDSVFAIFSTTKAITGTAALQLVEDGRLDLDAPAKSYVPEIGELQVLDGFDAAGAPLLREPKRDITTRMLLLHTAGFGYDFFNENYKRLTQEHGYPGVATSTKACITTPLLFDPGDAWEYGTSVDWAGQVVERIAGKRLGAVLQERVFEPLGMHETRFSMTPSMHERLACIHQRGADGTLTPLVGFELPQEPEIDMGGGGLYATVGDYMRFIRMWLNDGVGEFGRVLKPETVRMASQNGLQAQRVKLLPGVIPELSNDAEFFPGEPMSWALTFLLNEGALPTGRPAGSLSWAGLANTYFWIDTTNGVGGYWATQILPFIDGVSYPGFVEFETSVYRSIAAKGELARV